MSSFDRSSQLSIDSFPPIEIDPSLDFQHKITKLGFEHWTEKAAGRAMPDRRDIDPRAFGAHLGHLTLFNIRFSDGAVDELVPRLVGSDFESVFGDLMSAPLDKKLPRAIYGRWRRVVEGMMEAGGPVRATGPVVFEDKQNLVTELVVAPLSSEGTDFAVLYVVSVFMPSTPDDRLPDGVSLA